MRVYGSKKYSKQMPEAFEINMVIQTNVINQKFYSFKDVKELGNISIDYRSHEGQILEVIYRGLQSDVH